MNIRRLKKKKYAPLSKNEEEIAKDKLFEISYYCQEKYVDESQILAIDHRHLDPELHHHRRTEELHNLIRRKQEAVPDPAGSRLKTVETRLEGKHIEALPKNTHQKCIYNLLISSSVFVGAKEKMREAPQPQEHPVILIDPQHRVHTLPQLGREEEHWVGGKVRTEESERAKNVLSSNQQKFQRVSFSLNRRNYLRLKERVRHDLFVKSLGEMK